METASCLRKFYALSLALLLIAAGGQANAATPLFAADSPAFASGPRAAFTSHSAAESASTLLFAGIVDQFFNYFERFLSDRRSMLQFGLVMMLLGLWIIWWKKK